MIQENKLRLLILLKHTFKDLLLRGGGEAGRQVRSGLIPVILKYHIFISNYVNRIMLYILPGRFCC